MSDVILNEFRIGVNGLVQDMEQIKDEVRSTEKVAVDSGKKIKKSFDDTATSTKSLKQQLKELKAQIAVTTDPKEVQRLSKAAGELADKMNDANESVKVFSSGSKLEQVGNAFGSIVSNIRNLDFERASEQAKVLLTIMRSLTFAEAISGVKALANTFLDLGKALLLNPFTAIAAAIAAIVYVTYDAVSAFKDFNTQSKTLSESLKASEDRIVGLGNKQAEYLIKLAQAQGKLTKAQADAKLNELKNFQDRTDLAKKFGEDVKKLAEELGLSLSEIGKDGKFSEAYTGDYKDLLARVKFNKEFTQLQQRFRQEQSFLLKNYVLEQQNINQNSLNETANKQKENNEKIKALNEERIEEEKRLNKILRDLRTGNIAPDFEREKQVLKDKLADDIEQYRKNGAILVELRIKYINDLNKLETAQRAKELEEQKKAADAQIAINQAKIDAIQKQEDQMDEDYSKKIQLSLEQNLEAYQKEIDARKKLQDELASFINSSLGAISQLTKQNSEREIENLETQKDRELDALEKKYEGNLISQQEYEKEKAKIEENSRKAENEIKRRQFEIDKNVAIVQATISGAQAALKALASAPPPYNFILAALSAVAVATQIAIISRQQPPKFEDGGRVGGRRHSQGGTIIEAEEGEWLTKRNQAMKYAPILKAINEGQAEQFIKVHYIAPALREYKAKQDRAVSVNVSSSGSFRDSNILDSLKLSRQQSRADFMFLAKALKQNQRSKNKW